MPSESEKGRERGRCDRKKMPQELFLYLQEKGVGEKRLIEEPRREREGEGDFGQLSYSAFSAKVKLSRSGKFLLV